MQEGVFAGGAAGFFGVLGQESDGGVEGCGIVYLQPQMSFLFCQACFYVVEYVELFQVGADVDTGYFNGHQCAVGFIPSGFAAVEPGTAAVGVAIGEALRDFPVGLDAFGVSMDDIAQQFGIKRVAGGAVELEEHVARLCAEARCAVLVLGAGPHGAGEIGLQAAQRSFGRQAVGEGYGPGGAEVGQVLGLLQIGRFMSGFVEGEKRPPEVNPVSANSR